jgi:hypothetical protein
MLKSIKKTRPEKSCVLRKTESKAVFLKEKVKIQKEKVRKIPKLLPVAFLLLTLRNRFRVAHNLAATPTV